MYEKRSKIFVILTASLMLVCLLRLIQMQLLPASFLQDEIAKLKRQRGRYRQLKTVRGKIFDRKGRILAVDEPKFQLHINYKLTSFVDERVRQKMPQEQMQSRIEDLQQIIDKCTYFGPKRENIESKIKKIDDSIWNLRMFQAWRQNCQKSDLFKKYRDNLLGVKSADFVADFEKHFPDPNDRLKLINQTNITEMHKTWRLLDLKTDDDIFTAQLEFMDVEGVQILPKAQRFYPYSSVAAQTIGWVGKPQRTDKELFAEDRLASYLDDDEVCGREDGVEYVCEAILRGRRGEEVYDIDRELVNRIETQFGKDVALTLDIELQKKIENYIADCELNPNCKAPTAAVVIDIATGDILALVSAPVFDLNRARYDYDALASDHNEPLRNRAINKQYPPGSAVKPLIFIAGLESGKITPDEIIQCPAQKAPKGWPSCWLYNKYHWRCHDDEWPNNARNAIKGSCNIYFSRLADRIEPAVLQRWLFKFGYGQKILLPPAAIAESKNSRNLRQAQGQISDILVSSTISDFNDIPLLKTTERRYFGIGQGNLRATPLQVANAFAAIARGGILKPPRLFIDSRTTSIENLHRAPIGGVSSIDLNISPQPLDVVRDGMNAVVSEPGGTAYKEFAPVLAGFAGQDVSIYGKTGSTEKPDNAWFAGFARDSTGRGIAIAIVVEGGQHGSSDAAPLARDIIQFCIEAGYIGRQSPDNS